MGLIQAAAGAIGGTMADQWKEMIYCENIPTDVLVVKGKKRTNSRTSNTRGEDNVITDGSAVIVNDGQCMIIVEQGKVVEICAQPGEFTYNNRIAPSLFTGSLDQGISQTFAMLGKRFTYGGDTGTDQRVYYVNTKEIIGNRYGTANPVPFRVVDQNIGLDIDISVRCNGEYSYRITNPILFYTNVCGNVEEPYTRQEIDSQLKSELLTALQPAFAKISALGVRYSAIPGHTQELADALNEALSNKWANLRGIEVASFGVNAIAANEEDEKMIKELQRNAAMRDPRMAAAVLAGAQADAMVGAANNQGGMGAMGGFFGMNMAQNAGGMNAQQMFAMGSQPNQSQYQQAPNGGFGGVNAQGMQGSYGAQSPQPAQQQPPMQPAWQAQPTQQPVSPVGAAESWVCPACGTQNAGKFCMECGTPKPAAQPKYCCDKCGWVPEDQTKPPKFCPNCGDRFDENDLE